MIEKTRYERLFSTPVLRFQLPDHERLNTELLHAGGQLRDADTGVDMSNRGGWHSSGNLFDNFMPCFRELRAAAEQAVLLANETIGAKADPDALSMKLFAWMNANPGGGFNAPHTHPGAHWSGVYYVSQPRVASGNSGMIEFLDPRTDLPQWRILRAAPFKLKKKLRPEPGEMILFPSYLVHWVYPNESVEERVSIAFNATFKKAKTKADDDDAQ